MLQLGELLVKHAVQRGICVIFFRSRKRVCLTTNSPTSSPDPVFNRAVTILIYHRHKPARVFNAGLLARSQFESGAISIKVFRGFPWFQSKC
jgi:hypothetical protein